MQNIRQILENTICLSLCPWGSVTVQTRSPSFAFECVISQVVGVKNGGCKYYDSCFFKEITELFTNSENCEVCTLYVLYKPFSSQLKEINPNI